MAFLLPQFKCAPSDYLIFPLCKSKGSRAITTLSATTASSLGETEELRIPSPQSHRPLTKTSDMFSYTGGIDSYAKMKLEATFVAESLLASEESIIEAAAAEAFALARAAAQVAKDAAKFVARNPSLKYGSCQLPSQADILREEMIRLVEVDFPDKPGRNSGTLKTTPVEELMNQTSTIDNTEIADPTENDVQMLEAQQPKGKAVTSGRQSERKARRTRAVKKASTVGLSVKYGPSGRKKRTLVQEVDFADPLRYLRGTTSTTRLLSSSEELELSLAIQDLLKLERLQEELTKRYGSEPTFSQWAAAAGVDRRTLRKRLNHGVLSKDKMVTSNIRLVISIAKNYQGAGLTIQDLVQEGCRGLVRGAEKFDASKGFKFSTYAHWWIKQAVRKSLSDQSRTIRLPFHMVDATYRVKEARKQLYSENGKYPDNKEVAEATGLSMKRLTAVMLTPKAPISLDQKIGINQDMKPSDVLADPDAESAESLLMKQFMKMDLNKVLNSLNPREEKVVRLRFGLEDGRMRTLQEIGELMGVSRERIRQIESCAFRKLKNKRRTKCLQQYLFSSS